MGDQQPAQSKLAASASASAQKPSSSFQLPDRFPEFNNGDAVVLNTLSTPVTRYKLHAKVLAAKSPWFASTMYAVDSDKRMPAWFAYSMKVVDGKLQIVRDAAQGEHRALGEAKGAQDGINSKTEDKGPDATAPIFSRSAFRMNYPTRDLALEAYINILRLFYDQPLSLCTTSIHTAMHQCSALIRVAAPLGCIPLLRPHIDSHLAQYRQELFTAITDDPPSFLLLGMALQNRSIYTECMVHVCGAWPAWPFKTKIKQMMKPQDPLHLLIEKKTVERDAAILQTENDLMLITIHIPDGTMRRPVKCTDQAWLETWVIVQVFHDHLTYALRTLAFDKKASLKRGVLFRTIHKGVNAYMEYEYARDLCKKIMPLGFKREFGQDLKNLKEHAALITRHLAKNELMIDPDQHDLGYLTCTKIEDADIIWNME